jgi:hypothetical protein
MAKGMAKGKKKASLGGTNKMVVVVAAVVVAVAVAVAEVAPTTTRLWQRS